MALPVAPRVALRAFVVDGPAVSPPIVMHFPRAPRISQSNDYNQVEQAIYAVAYARDKSMRDAIDPRFSFDAGHDAFARKVVRSYRWKTRFEGMSPMERLFAEIDEKGAIFQANQFRVNMHGSFDRPEWQASADRSGPVFEEGTFEVWMHGDAEKLIRKNMVNGQVDEEVILPSEILARLYEIGYAPPMKIGIVACESGLVRGHAQVLSTVSGSNVWGVPDASFASWPLTTPYGQREFTPDGPLPMR